jgi:hypothetical protein
MDKWSKQSALFDKTFICFVLYEFVLFPVFVVIHETGHYLMSIVCGINVEEIFLSVLGMSYNRVSAGELAKNPFASALLGAAGGFAVFLFITIILSRVFFKEGWIMVSVIPLVHGILEGMELYLLSTGAINVVNTAWASDIIYGVIIMAFMVMIQYYRIELEYS